MHIANKAVVLSFLLSTTNGAASNLKNTDWPKYATTSTAASYVNTKLHNKGYGCIRNNFYWAFPQNVVSNTVVTGVPYGIKTFYATTTAELGTVQAENTTPNS